MGTKLDIVNHMLATIGERGQITLSSGHPSVIQAVQILDSNDYDFQGRGWWFNTETCIALAQTVNGEVPLPSETMEFRLNARTLQYADPADKNRYSNLDGRVYDNVEHTYTLNRTIYADLTLRRKVEALPAPAYTYLKHLAALAMAEDEDQDATKIQRLDGRRSRAWQQLMAAQLKATAPNALDTPAAMALRYRIRQYGSPSNPMFPGGRG